MIGAITGSTFLNVSRWLTNDRITAATNRDYLSHNQVYIYGAITVAVPSIGRDLNFTEADLPWPVQAFKYVLGCFLLLAGRLADKYGRRNVFLAGTCLYTLLSIPPIFCPGECEGA
ncbi:hypothetical protein OE88DRAFT_1657326 [Heliocybe sulcata]|uniref:Major facilitator superfamily (MFS) profile domain-containing protein n=1 Tax=Heliocybe sulcata TaxID=5364 RepID=A0A5C3N394_9AGAM|nr:hypothetical protein OE88DRAFT_1657326 [Heliocybe sulcata]